MRYLLIILTLFPIASMAQTVHVVEAGGSTIGGTPPYFSPQDIEISLGDTVRWTAVSGTHNVNGSVDDFPDNPEGFYSGAPVPGLGFEHVFTIPGEYHYHCDQEGHAVTQFGSITVLNTSSIGENGEAIEINVYPVPSNDVLIIDLGKNDIDVIEVISVDGRKVYERPINGRDRVEIYTADLATGQYHLRLIHRNGRISTRPFRKS